METRYNLKDGSTIIGNIMTDFVKGSFIKESIIHHAKSMCSVFNEIHRKKTGNEFNEVEKKVLMQEMIKKAGEEFNLCVKNNPCPECVNDILSNDYKKNRQISLLKGLQIRPEHFASIFHRGEELGYSASQIRFEGIPKGYTIDELPKFAHIDEDGKVISVGGEKFSEGQIKAFINQAHVLIARVLERNGQWHCFVQTFKGIKGQESGVQGSQPHIHYISDKFCQLSFEDLINMLKHGNYPNSPVHIPLIDYQTEDNTNKNGKEL